MMRLEPSCPRRFFYDGDIGASYIRDVGILGWNWDRFDLVHKTGMYGYRFVFLCVC